MEFPNNDCLAKEAAVADFVQDFRDDARADGPRALSVYLRRYPEAEPEIATEFLKLTAVAADAEQSATMRPLMSSESHAAREGDAAGAELVGGRYRIMELLGSGGQGSVFLAYDERVGRRVALKVLDRGFLSSTQRMRLQREAAAIASVDHPGIAEVLDARFDGDTPFLAIRFIDGFTLTALYRGSATLPGVQIPPTDSGSVHKLVGFFYGAARAVDAAHAAGFLHRDIKPANLMIHGGESAVVLDFGLALRTDQAEEALTRDGEGVGTPEYMAPEQISSLAGSVDARTDVYGLGASLYEALTGERPFRGTTVHDLEEEILRGALTTAVARNAAVSKDLSVVVQTAMDVDPNRRYASAAAFADELDRVLTSKPILARPSGPMTKLYRWAKRQPALAGTLAALVVVIAAGLTAAVITIRNRYELIEQKDEALNFAIAQLLVRSSADALERDPSEALALAREAFAHSPDAQTRSALFRPLLATRRAGTLTTDSAAPLWSATFAPNPEVVLAIRSPAKGDGRSDFKLWTWRAGKPYGESVSVPLQSGDGALILPLDDEGTDVLLVGREGCVCRVAGKRVTWEANVLGAFERITNDEELVCFSGPDQRLSLETGEAASIRSNMGASTQVETASDPVAWSLTEEPESGVVKVEVRGGDFAAPVEVEAPWGSEPIAAVSRDGTRVAIATKGPDRVQAFDVVSGEQLIDETGRINPNRLAWSDDGTKLLVVSYPSKVLIFQTSRPPELSRLASTSGEAELAWFANDGRSATILRKRGVLENWSTPIPIGMDGSNGEGHATLRSAHSVDGAFSACQVSKDKRRLVVARASGDLDLYDLGAPGGSMLLGSIELGLEVTSLQFLGEDGGAVVALARSGEVVQWNPERGEATRLAPGVAATTISATPSGDTVFIGDSDSAVHVLQDGVETTELRRPFTDGNNRAVHVLEVSPDGKRLAVGHRKYILRLWDIENPDADPDEIRRINFTDLRWRPSSDGLVMMYKAPRGGTFMLVDVVTFTTLANQLGKNVTASSVAFTADSSVFVAACANGRAIACDRSAGTVLEFGLHEAPPTVVAASPLARDPRILTVDEEGGAYLWTLTPEVTAQNYSPLELSQSLKASFGLVSNRD